MKMISRALLVIILFSLKTTGSMNERMRWNAKNYQNNSEPQYPAVQEFVHKITNTFHGDEYILDIGCGPGTKTAELAQRVPNGFVYGIDASLNMIENAIINHTQHNLKFLHAGAEFFEFKEQFDFICSFSCLHWVKNQQEVLNNIAKYLKNGGTFLGTMALKQHSLDQIVTLLAQTVLQKKWKKYVPEKYRDKRTRKIFLKEQVFPQTAEKIVSMLIESGIKPIELKIIEKSMTFKKETFIDWLKCWIIGFPILELIPDEKLDKFIIDFVNNYLTYHHIKNDLLIPYSSYILLIHGQKDI